jgi:hypothetical protein
MNTTEVIYLTKKGLKELKRQIARLERRQKQILAKLRTLDKRGSRFSVRERVEKLNILETIKTELTEKKRALARVKLISQPGPAMLYG